jgi:hypothetical protein
MGYQRGVKWTHQLRALSKHDQASSGGLLKFSVQIVIVFGKNIPKEGLFNRTQNVIVFCI